MYQHITRNLPCDVLISNCAHVNFWTSPPTAKLLPSSKTNRYKWWQPSIWSLASYSDGALWRPAHDISVVVLGYAGCSSSEVYLIWFASNAITTRGSRRCSLNVLQTSVNCTKTNFDSDEQRRPQRATSDSQLLPVRREIATFGQKVRKTMQWLKRRTWSDYGRVRRNNTENV